MHVFPWIGISAVLIFRRPYVRNDWYIYHHRPSVVKHTDQRQIYSKLVIDHLITYFNTFLLVYISLEMFVGHKIPGIGIKYPASFVGHCAVRMLGHRTDTSCTAYGYAAL